MPNPQNLLEILAYLLMILFNLGGTPSDMALPTDMQSLINGDLLNGQWSQIAQTLRPEQTSNFAMPQSMPQNIPQDMPRDSSTFQALSQRRALPSYSLGQEMAQPGAGLSAYTPPAAMAMPSGQSMAGMAGYSQVPSSAGMTAGGLGMAGLNWSVSKPSRSSAHIAAGPVEQGYQVEDWSPSPPASPVLPVVLGLGGLAALALIAKRLVLKH